MENTKRKIYIGLFVVLYLFVGVVSLIHSFAFFGLANNTPMSVMLGCCFEIGQVAVLMSLLTSKKEQSRVMPWVLMVILTLVQILGNVFSSYKYLITNSSENLRYFKEPIFVWTDLPDDITTVIITYIVGGILPIIALCMTSMVSNYINNDPILEEPIDKPDNEPILGESIVKPDNDPILGESIVKPDNDPILGESIVKPDNDPILEESIVKSDNDPILEESKNIDNKSNNYFLNI